MRRINYKVQEVKMRTLKETQELIACGLGEAVCDWKLENVMLVDVFSDEIFKTYISREKG